MAEAAQPTDQPVRTGAEPTAAGSPLLRLNFATLWVRDQERSRRFFVDQLGFQTVVETEVPGQGKWLVVAPSRPGWLAETAGGELPGIALWTPAEGSPEWGRIGQNTGLGFVTEDVRAVHQDWSRRGVRFTAPPFEPAWGSGQARYAVFEDVDGNSFSLIEFDAATRAMEAERRARALRREAEQRAAHDIAIAREVQARLLPQRQPALRSLAYAGLCQPAESVGGDYYDFLDLGEGRLGFIIADIAGKGMAAALLMANLQASLRGQSATARADPRGFLRRVNGAFHENTATRDYASLFFAEYDDASRTLQYVGCGHPPALLLRRDGGLERLSSTAAVLGLFADWDCALEERQLAPGELLLLYTDGATESFDAAGAEFGEPGLAAALRRHQRLAPGEMAAAVAADVRAFSRGAQEDDITLIAARCI